MDEIYEIVDNLLKTTTDRNLIPAAEIQDFVLDIRSALMKLKDPVTC